MFAPPSYLDTGLKPEEAGIPVGLTSNGHGCSNMVAGGAAVASPVYFTGLVMDYRRC